MGSIGENLRRIATAFTVRDVMVRTNELKCATVESDAVLVSKSYPDFTIIPIKSAGRMVSYFNRETAVVYPLELSDVISDGTSIFELVDVPSRWKVVSPYHPEPTSAAPEYPAEPPKAAEAPAEIEEPRWKRAVVPILRMIAFASAVPSEAAASGMPPVPTISALANPPQPTQLATPHSTAPAHPLQMPIRTTEIDSGDLTEDQLQGAIECFFQPTEADEMSAKLVLAFPKDATPEEHEQAKASIHSLFAEVREQSKEIARDLLKDALKDAVKGYVVLRLLGVLAKRLKKRGQDTHNKLLLWLASAVEAIENLIDKKPEPKAVSTEEVSKAIPCTPTQAEAILSATFFVKLHNEWYPPRIIYTQPSFTGDYSAHSHDGLGVYRAPDWSYPPQLRVRESPDAEMIIEKQGEQIREQQQEIQTLRIKLAELQEGKGNADNNPRF